MSLLADEIRHHTIDSNSRHEQCETRKDAEQLHLETVRRPSLDPKHLALS